MRSAGLFRRSGATLGIYDWWRKNIAKPIRDGGYPGEPQHPFGTDFGLTILPDFVNENEQLQMRKQYVDLMIRKSPDVVASDGRIQLPPLNPESFSTIISRLENDGHVDPGHLNNQTVNFFDENSFIRAHVDNLFVYDDMFAIVSLVSPCILKFVHMQTGEELEALIPPNSVYLMEGPARYVYMHMVPPTDLKRVSVVLRRSIFRSSGTFDAVDPRMGQMLPYRANAALDALNTKEIGTPRINVDEKWMQENKLGAFDTGEMVRKLHPMRDWSLRQQLAEDRERYDELREKGYLKMDLEWRFDELNEQFKAFDQQLAINSESMMAAEAAIAARKASNVDAAAAAAHSQSCAHHSH